MKYKLTLKQADAIRMDWGKFLEITNGNLMMFFLGNIPESFLPYPKETIEEALNIVAEHFHNQGNKEAVQVVQATIPYLISYVPDKQAIKSLTERISNQKYLDIVLADSCKKQKDQLKYIQTNR